MIVLSVVDSLGYAAFQNGAVLGDTIGNSRQDFGEMNGRIGIVVHAQQQHLAVEFVDPSHRAFGNVRRERQGILENELGLGSDSRERVHVRGAANSRASPEEAG